MKLWVSVSLSLGVLLSAVLSFAGPYDRLLNVLRTDDSYKVRMKALRVISKKARAQNKPAPEAVITAIAEAATQDEARLVRGMACIALGQLEDPRGKPALLKAQEDEEAFVRAQAESALQSLKPPAAPEPGGDLLVFGVDVVPGVQVSQVLQSDLLAFMKDVLHTYATDYRVANDGTDPGYQLRGSIAQVSQVPREQGGAKVTIEVKVTVSTWPAKNLRHVMSAKASAKVSGAQASLRVRRKVLRAAVQRAVQDALQQIKGT